MIKLVNNVKRKGDKYAETNVNKFVIICSKTNETNKTATANVIHKEFTIYQFVTAKNIVKTHAIKYSQNTTNICLYKEIKFLDR